MANFLATLAFVKAHLALVPEVKAAVQVFKDIGHSKESTIQKVGDIVKIGAAVGQDIPEPHVAAIAALVAAVADAVFGAPAAPTSPAPAPKTAQETTPILDAPVVG